MTHSFSSRSTSVRPSATMRSSSFSLTSGMIAASLAAYSICEWLSSAAPQSLTCSLLSRFAQGKPGPHPPGRDAGRPHLRDQLAGKICVVNTADLDAEMVSRPFCIKLGVVGDLDLFVGGKQIAERSKFGRGSQVADAWPKGLRSMTLVFVPLLSCDQPQVALIRVKLGRLDVKAQKFLRLQFGCMRPREPQRRVLAENRSP